MKMSLSEMVILVMFLGLLTFFLRLKVKLEPLEKVEISQK